MYWIKWVYVDFVLHIGAVFLRLLAISIFISFHRLMIQFTCDCFLSCKLICLWDKLVYSPNVFFLTLIESCSTRFQHFCTLPETPACPCISDLHCLPVVNILIFKRISFIFHIAAKCLPCWYLVSFLNCSKFSCFVEL